MKRSVSSSKQTLPKPIRVLIVDADRESRHMCADYIRQRTNWIAHTAANDYQALQLINRYEFDAVTTDVMHAPLGGISLCLQLKQFKSKTKVFLMSSWHEPWLPEDGTACGADYFVKKPITLKNYLTTLKRLLHQH